MINPRLSGIRLYILFAVSFRCKIKLSVCIIFETSQFFFLDSELYCFSLSFPSKHKTFNYKVQISRIPLSETFFRKIFQREAGIT